MPIVVDTTSPPLGSGLTGKAILDAAMSHIQDKSAGMRSAMTIWLTSLYQKAYAERDWLFLQTIATVSIESDIIVKPTDFGRLIYISGEEWHLEAKHRLTDREAFELVDDTTTDPIPMGFEETATLLILRPGGAGSANLKYTRLIQAAFDSNTPTVWPWKFLPLFERSLLSACYEYDSDQRGIPSMQLDQVELDRLKHEDNRQKPIPKPSRKGFLRWR